MKSFFQKLNANKSKKLAIALAVALSATAFAGCGSSQAPSKSSASSSTQQTQQANLDNLSDARNTPTVRAAAAVGPSVVGITNKAVARDFFNNPVESQGVGSGVIFKNDGGKSYIVTNNHVVDGANELIVSLADGRSLPGKLVGADALTDLAVVEVDDGNLPTADFGDSDATVVGESVIAIGNPMGLEFQGSVTSGVVSALNRTLGDGDARIKLLQTDAAINPGNSGGALVNMDGKVIGINSAKIVANGVEGIGLAIPSNAVQNIISAIMEKGYVPRPYLGVSIFDQQSAARYGYQLNLKKGVYLFQVVPGGPAYMGIVPNTLTAQMAMQYRYDISEGVFISYVEENSPASEAGLQMGDVITAIDGTEIKGVSDLRAKIAEHNVGDKVELTIQRGNQERKASLTLEEMPKDNN